MKYFLIISLLLCLSCEQELEQVLPEFEEKLVVTSFIHPDTTLTLYLTNSVDILSTQDPKAVTGSLIDLYEDDLLIGRFEETYFAPNYFDGGSDTLKGVYQLDYYPKEGRNYRIEVVSDNYQHLTSQTTIPNKTSEFSVNVEPINVILDDNDQHYGSVSVEFETTVTIKDAPGDNYYSIGVLLDLGDQIEEFDNEGNYIGCLTIHERHEIDFLSSSVVFEGSQSSAYHEDAGKVFNDDLFQNQEFEIKITFDAFAYYNEACDGEKVAFETLYIDVRSVSKEYYEYIRTTTLQKFILEDPFAEPVQIYNNIEGGLGVFAGYSTETFEFSLNEYFDPE